MRTITAQRGTVTDSSLIEITLCGVTAPKVVLRLDTPRHNGTQARAILEGIAVNKSTAIRQFNGLQLRTARKRLNTLDLLQLAVLSKRHLSQLRQATASSIIYFRNISPDYDFLQKVCRAKKIRRYLCHAATDDNFSDIRAKKRIRCAFSQCVG